MARLRKNSAYQNLERPYTRISKYSKQNYVRGGRPQVKIIKFDMGNPQKKFDTKYLLLSQKSMNIRHNALESARMSSNRLLEKKIPGDYHLRIRVYPHHVLRENPLASGAGADRMSTGMKLSYGKSIGTAARVMEGQPLVEVNVNKLNSKIARESLSRAAKKFPCSCKIVAK
ncbi:MAG TPA: 50S ribosomal protein L16 [Candidatus Nanoarchaeia archaeon]|nr:50S ribosomal protein L16 [Candidatus Nanoarchaeia archaeon]